MVYRVEELCKTPNNWNGTCIALQQCRPLYSLLTERNLSEELRDFLKQSKCGFKDDKPLVCCPNTLTPDDLPSSENNMCGVQVTDKIVGGEQTSITEFPWYVYDIIDEIIEIN